MFVCLFRRHRYRGIVAMISMEHGKLFTQIRKNVISLNREFVSYLQADRSESNGMPCQPLTPDRLATVNALVVLDRGLLLELMTKMSTPMESITTVNIIPTKPNRRKFFSMS